MGDEKLKLNAGSSNATNTTMVYVESSKMHVAIERNDGSDFTFIQ